MAIFNVVADTILWLGFMQIMLEFFPFFGNHFIIDEKRRFCIPRSIPASRCRIGIRFLQDYGSLLRNT